MSRKAYWGRNSQFSQRGSLNPRDEGLMHIKYKAGGDAWVSSLVAQIAVTRGEAKYVTAPIPENQKK